MTRTRQLLSDGDSMMSSLATATTVSSTVRKNPSPGPTEPTGKRSRETARSEAEREPLLPGSGGRSVSQRLNGRDADVKAESSGRPRYISPVDTDVGPIGLLAPAENKTHTRASRSLWRRQLAVQRLVASLRTANPPTGGRCDRRRLLSEGAICLTLWVRERRPHEPDAGIATI